MPRKVGRHNKTKKNNLPGVLVVIGVLVVVGLVMLIKDYDQKQSQSVAQQNSEATGELPAEQLETALAQGKPILAFFHSNSCYQCIEMIEIVERVYPEFVDFIELVDVNVYDDRNIPLLRQVKLQYIPTLIFYDRNGQDEALVGVMPDEQLHQKLTALKAGE